ncbi:hypothetical protein CALCODRAFT_295404 [Calocera cornea HHB12733]|uniref:Uncharacterized protein n=1 Tax=Calocera cornea HHB12733 TaxID=1353952 RepID=A0A165FP59_9BASI|nr:hypothetical protein CALCODRAFT_295404 [Calocera cornea HHB12733]
MARPRHPSCPPKRHPLSIPLLTHTCTAPASRFLYSTIPTKAPKSPTIPNPAHNARFSKKVAGTTYICIDSRPNARLPSERAHPSLLEHV